MGFFVGKKLHYFVVVMETRCLNQAAEKLCITRSPLGKFINDLEDYFKEKLFVRRYNTLEPTESALKLYERIRPAYNALLSVEDASIQKKGGGINILFDYTIPCSIICNLIAQINRKRESVSYQYVYINKEKIDSLVEKENTIIISYRKHMHPLKIRTVNFPKENLIVFYPNSITTANFYNVDIMRDIPLLIKRRGKDSEEFKGFFSQVIKKVLPCTYIEETDDDTTSALYRVVSGKAIVILPERVADIFTVKDVNKYKVNELECNMVLMFNEGIGRDKQLNEIISILKY